MDYSAQTAAYPDSPVPPRFEGLPKLAEQAEMAADRIQRFLDRFHGSPDVSGTQLAPVVAGHIGQLQRIERTIERFAQLANELDSIG